MKVTNRNLPVIYLFFLFFVFLIIISLFRPLEGDTRMYHKLFLECQQENISNVEYSFIFLSKICYILGNERIGFRLLLSIYAVIDAVILLQLFHKSKYPLFFFIIFYISFYKWFMYSLIRASVAYLFCFSSIYDIAYQNKKKAILKILIGTLFHYSVMWFIVLIPLGKRIKTNFQLKLFSFFSLIGILIISPVLNILFSKIGPSNYLFAKIWNYYFYGVYFLHPLSIKSIFLILVYCYFLMNVNIKTISPVSKVSLLFLSFVIIFHFFGVYIIGEFGSRIRDFIYIGTLFFAPELISSIKHKQFITIYLFLGAIFFSIKESNLIFLLG